MKDRDTTLYGSKTKKVNEADLKLVVVNGEAVGLKF